MKNRILLILLIINYLCISFVNAQTSLCANNPLCNQYVMLQEKLDGTIQIVYNKSLWIKYDEFYGDTNTTYLTYSIFDEDRNLLFETNDDGTRKTGCFINPVAKHYGLNWLRIPLTCPSIEYEKFYFIEVWNAKGEKHYLRFYCIRPFMPQN